ncbi:MAG: hypothetical protein A2904_01730 [Candidatus Staskawiczbacteria bacterium RIFCSPLOWO2_01_FULL_33_9]|uniref:Uncharacterized protein n=1 Tax=Candidatus Staskawiczbacteria bacterium RIFCSPLOWO2_01_FULL_33_9 TaxID=1802211 RepID=A0A1G2IAY0_9BACT|nr:MAG: hypothetical protein A2904_01730 [Candidatus Staskawiczbacteria bacterium RIFCSPLOWO2_01_FULL_33_9]
MKGKNITIDQLAVMVNKGFEGTNKRMDLGFKKVNDRLDRIENILIKQQNEKIEALEKRMHRLEDALVINK